MNRYDYDLPPFPPAQEEWPDRVFADLVLLLFFPALALIAALNLWDRLRGKR